MLLLSRGLWATRPGCAAPRPRGTWRPRRHFRADYGSISRPQQGREPRQAGPTSSGHSQREISPARLARGPLALSRTLRCSRPEMRRDRRSTHCRPQLRRSHRRRPGQTRARGRSALIAVVWAPPPPPRVLSEPASRAVRWTNARTEALRALALALEPSASHRLPVPCEGISQLGAKCVDVGGHGVTHRSETRRTLAVSDGIAERGASSTHALPASSLKITSPG